MHFIYLFFLNYTYPRGVREREFRICVIDNYYIINIPLIYVTVKKFFTPPRESLSGDSIIRLELARFRSGRGVVRISKRLRLSRRLNRFIQSRADFI